MAYNIFMAYIIIENKQLLCICEVNYPLLKVPGNKEVSSTIYFTVSQVYFLVDSLTTKLKYINKIISPFLDCCRKY